MAVAVGLACRVVLVSHVVVRSVVTCRVLVVAVSAAVGAIWCSGVG